MVTFLRSVQFSWRSNLFGRRVNPDSERIMSTYIALRTGSAWPDKPSVRLLFTSSTSNISERANLQATTPRTVRKVTMNRPSTIGDHRFAVILGSLRDWPTEAARTQNAHCTSFYMRAAAKLPKLSTTSFIDLSYNRLSDEMRLRKLPKST